MSNGKGRGGIPDDCTCPVAFRSLGKLYGISLGKGWVRLSDDRRCPRHGERRP
jgi:rubredoxin